MSVPPVAVMYLNTLPWTRILILMLSGDGNGYLRKNKNLVILVRTLNAKSPGKTKSLAHFNNFESQFTTDVKQFRKHVFNIHHHYHVQRELRQRCQTTSNECGLHIDFSENYSCGYSSEIQRVHFGASHNQATLHTGILYVDQDTVSFCTISDSRRPDPAAIWSYLSPVFEYIRNNHSEVNTVHFVSDGPTTQYSQNKNFYLFYTQLYKEGFAGGGSWNFSEAGHGKGAAYGVGGVLKRTADDIISRGQDLPDAATLFHALVNTGTFGLNSFWCLTVISTSSQARCLLISYLSQELWPFHQFVTHEPYKIASRVVDCLCEIDLMCSCYNTNRIPVSNTRIYHTNQRRK